MMKITRVKKSNLFRRESHYTYTRGDREIGHLVDRGNDDIFDLEMEGQSCRIERTRSGIATGRLAGLRNLLNRRATGEFRLVNNAGAEIATARQPGPFEYYVSSGQAALNVASKQNAAKLQVSGAAGATIGTIARGAWKITGRNEWNSSLPDTIDPRLEAFLLCLYVMSDKRAEDSSTYTQ